LRTPARERWFKLTKRARMLVGKAERLFSPKSVTRRAAGQAIFANTSATGISNLKTGQKTRSKDGHGRAMLACFTASRLDATRGTYGGTFEVFTIS
jgi:hypothetical protein